jgi:hypothetical protein
MADPASHVEHPPYLVEPPALRDTLEEVAVPPVVARVSEVLGGVRVDPFELVGHDVAPPRRTPR